MSVLPSIRLWRGVAPVLRQALRRPDLLLAGACVLLVILAALAPGWLTPFDPLRGDARLRLLPPGAGHWFGTDQLGRDLFTRVVYGTRESLKAAVVAVLTGLVIGSGIGLISGTMGRIADDLLMRAMDVMLAVPTLLIALAVINALGFGTINIALAVGIGSVASFARLMRAEVLRIRTLPYVEAAQFSGRSSTGILLRHVLPNASGPVLVLATLEVGMAMLSVAALGFLGFGAPPPTPEWGILVAGGREYMRTAWWLITLPGLVIVISVMAFGHVARAIGGEADR